MKINIVRSILIGLLHITFSVSHLLSYQETYTGEQSGYFKSSAYFQYRIRFPQNYHPTKKYIWIIGLHGGGSNLDKFIKIWEQMKPDNLVYVVPQAPYAWLLNEKMGYDWSLWPSKNKTAIKQASKLVGLYIGDLIIQIKSKYPADKLYLLGFSQGAIFTYISGFANHQYLEGIICLSGPGIFKPLNNPFIGGSTSDWLKNEDIKKAKALRVFIGHGKSDPLAKYALGVNSRDVLKKYNYDVTFNSFEGGHEINQSILRQVLNWLGQDSP